MAGGLQRRTLQTHHSQLPQVWFQQDPHPRGVLLGAWLPPPRLQRSCWPPQRAPNRAVGRSWEWPPSQLQAGRATCMWFQWFQPRGAVPSKSMGVAQILAGPVSAQQIFRGRTTTPVYPEGRKPAPSSSGRQVCSPSLAGGQGI